MTTLTATDQQRYTAWLTEQAWLMLTPTELRIVHALGSSFGAWLPTSLIVERVYGDDVHDPGLLAADLCTVRTHLWRIRRKLAHTPWRIENYTVSRRGAYRLVAVQ